MAALKTTGFLCTYNDCEYLDAAITSFLPAVDKLYIIEGSWKSTQGYPSTGPRSDKATYNVIDKHVDGKKVFLIQANEAGEKEQRQVGLEKAKEDGSDWCWMLDSDEIYPKSVITVIRNQMATMPASIQGLRVRSFNFINSFSKWYDGNYARIYRVTPGAKFWQNNDVTWGLAPHLENIKTISDRWRFFHYCYAKKDPAQFWRKMHYHETEDPTFKERITPQYGAKGHIYTIPGDIPIYDFKGKHLKIMQEHPNFAANIYGDNDLKFSEE